MQTKKILIIDDDNRNIFALKAVLKSKKYNCETAISAADGFKLLASDSEIGILLLDMMMPELDGYETIRLIRANESLNTLPIVAVTAQAMVGDREKCLAAGADAYIAKPIDVDILMQLLKKYL